MRAGSRADPGAVSAGDGCDAASQVPFSLIRCFLPPAQPSAYCTAIFTPILISLSRILTALLSGGLIMLEDGERIREA